jgi:hypothetical protein
VEPYDQTAWDALERERRRKLARSRRRLVPAAVRDRARQFGDKARVAASAVPGFDQAEELFEQVLAAAGDVSARLAADSLGTERILTAYREAGHESLELIPDIQRLSLRDIDKVKPHLDIAYIAAVVASGAAAGFVVSGGEVAALAGAAAGGAVGAGAGAGVGAVPGAGAGAAPGAGIVVGAIAADSAAVLFATARVIFHIAAYYGYDVDRPEERLRAMSVLNYATATGQAAKNQAYLEVQKVAGLIVRNATWKQLDQNTVTKIVRRVFEKLSQRLTKRKLGVAVPVVGIAAGALLNGLTLSQAADAADMLYRQQFLCDKYGIPFPSGSDRGGGDGHYDDDDISVEEIIEDVAEQSEAGPRSIAMPDDGLAGPARTADEPIATLLEHVDVLGDPAEWAAATTYSSLALAVIDSVWSIGVRYAGVRNVVARYRVSRTRDGANADTDTPADLANVIDRAGGPEVFADIVENRQRTSSRGGILKAEAIRLAAGVLIDAGMTSPADITAATDGRLTDLRTRWTAVRGQGSGLSWDYFLMLCGRQGVKADRMVRRFVADAPEREEREISQARAHQLVTEAAGHLGLRVSQLDFAIWRYQSGNTSV